MQKISYSLKSISIIIPTYNRPSDLKETLNSFLEEIPKLREIIIIDQSEDKKTKKVVQAFQNKKIQYIHTDVPSLTKARNIGISKISKKSQIAIFLDDDVTLGENYFKKILSVFNENPEAKGVSGWFKPPIKISKYEQFAKKLFLIEHLENEKARAISAYGNTYPFRLMRIIRSQWLSGFNMAYKKEVFNEEQFDENLLRYALAEDFDFSYRVHKKYIGSLFITPFAEITHRASIVERYPTEKAAFMNQINHFYIHFKNFPRFVEQIKFFWCIFGIGLLRILIFIKSINETDRLKMSYFYKSLWYCFRNLRKIKRGELTLPKTFI